MNKSDLISVRGYLADDYNFILATWLRSLWYGADNKSILSKNGFMRKTHQDIDDILKNVHIKVATLKEDPDVILGYSVSRLGKPIWVYVKKSWRGIGIAKSLLNHTKEIPNEND